VAIVILYLLSIDEKVRFTFAYTQCMNIIIKLIIHFPEPLVGKELISLAINLAANKRNAEILSEDEIRIVCERALEKTDILLFKFIKNIAINAEA